MVVPFKQENYKYARGLSEYVFRISKKYPLTLVCDIFTSFFDCHSLIYCWFWLGYSNCGFTKSHKDIPFGGNEHSIEHKTLYFFSTPKPPYYCSKLLLNLHFGSPEPPMIPLTCRTRHFSPSSSNKVVSADILRYKMAYPQHPTVE